MSGSIRPVPEDPIEQLIQDIDKIRWDVEQLQMPTGTQIFEAKAKLEQALSEIGTYVDAYLASGFTTGSMTASGSITVGGNANVTGTVTGTAGVSSVGAYNLNVVGLPGSGRVAAWIHSSGAFGQTVSSERFKTNIRPLPYTAEQFMSVMAVVFEYIAQRAIRDDPENPYYDPNYVVPIDGGVIAERLLEAGLDLYVQWADDEQTIPQSVDYALFATHAALVIGHAHERQIQDINARLDAAGI